MKQRKTRYMIGAAICVGAIVWMVTSLSANLNYMMTVSEAVKARSHQGTQTFRAGGVVKKGSILSKTRDGARFTLTDGPGAMDVHLQAQPPSLFRDCAPIIVQGHWVNDLFVGDQIVVQHGEVYDMKGHSIGKTLAAAGCPDQSVASQSTKTTSAPAQTKTT